MFDEYNTNPSQGDISEFERELENYLPTPENTDKVKKPIPVCLSTAVASALTCIVLFTVYTLLFLPSVRPAPVISYTDTPANSGVKEPADGTISEIYLKVSPSIVAIESESSYRNFFGISSSTNTGSGIVISPDGYILTSSSLIGTSGETTVTLPGGKKLAANFIGSDASRDIAVIKIDETNLPAATLGNSDYTKAGDTAIVIGNVLGSSLGNSITKGIICGVNKGVAQGAGSSINLFQTDAITNSGNAGGCLVNADGDVIGMITYAVSSKAENISFAIPSNDIKSVTESLISTGSVPTGLRIGITGTDSEHGVVVETVSEDTPARTAGIEVGDLILKVDGAPVKSVSEINKIKDTHLKGDTIVLTIYRAGEILDIKVTL